MQHRLRFMHHGLLNNETMVSENQYLVQSRPDVDQKRARNCLNILLIFLDLPLPTKAKLSRFDKQISGKIIVTRVCL